MGVPALQLQHGDARAVGLDQEARGELAQILNDSFDAAAIRERADLLEMERSLQADLATKGMIFNKPDPVQFRAALVQAGFYNQWQKTYGPEAWAQLEKYTGKLV